MHSQVTMPDGRVVSYSAEASGSNFEVSLTAKPDGDILKWGMSVDATKDEYFTGIMERVVDRREDGFMDCRTATETLNLRGQKMEMIFEAHHFGLRAVLYFIAELRFVRARRLAGIF